MEFERMEGIFQISRCAPETPIPARILQESRFTVTRTADELSIISRGVPAEESEAVEPGWKG